MKVLRTIFQVFIVILFMSVLAFMSLVAGVKKYLTSSFNSDNQVIYIKKGSNLSQILDILDGHGIIRYKYLLSNIIKLKTHNNPKIFFGEFFFKKGITVAEIIELLLKNKLYYRSITFPEGLTTHTILEMLNNNEYLVNNIGYSFPEGIYLPETYYYLRGENKADILSRMQKSMDIFLTEAWNNRDKDVLLKNKYEALVVASLIEKETSLLEEKKLVASVIFNRLRKRMPLQIDPTVIYAFTLGNKNLERPIRKSDLKRQSDYNTYKKYGLPPTPICNPGRDSILAALHPAKTNFLYFVANKKGGHNFSESYRAHVNNVNSIK